MPHLRLCVFLQNLFGNEHAVTRGGDYASCVACALTARIETLNAESLASLASQHSYGRGGTGLGSCDCRLGQIEAAHPIVKIVYGGSE